MSFFAENYAFIKDVYDARSSKMIEIMDKTDAIIKEVMADKIYTSNDFAKLKDQFTSIAKNMEQSEVKDWLESTKETLMGDKDAKQKGEEDTKLQQLLDRFNALIPKVTNTKQVADLLWKAYKFTDELSPSMEWLVEKKVMATREINSNSAGETEELIEKQEKVIDQLDKKRKTIMALIEKGTKLKDDPKSPAFLAREVLSMKNQWEETNNLALDRLDRLKDNLVSWETYEKKRNELFEKLVQADQELEAIKKVYDVTEGPKDVENRIKTAASIRKSLTEVYDTVDKANETVQALLTEDMKCELNDQVAELKQRMEVNDYIDEKIKKMDEFNGGLKEFIKVLEELEKLAKEYQDRFVELTNPDAKFVGEEKVLATMQLGDDVREQLGVHEAQQVIWDDNLSPSQSGEDTPQCKEISDRMDTVVSSLEELNAGVEAEAEKYGEDVKYLAEFTNSCKKFEPWINKSESKVKSGMKKPESLEEANDVVAEVKAFQENCVSMKALLDAGKEAADKMAKHDEPDRQYAVFAQRWTAVNKMAEAWQKRMAEMVVMWEKQAATADKVNGCLTAPAGSDVKVEDLEGLLANMKTMFIEKQKMVDGLNVVPS